MPSRALPTINTREQLLPYLKQWSRSLAPLLRRPTTPQAPWRFRVTNQRGGLLLEWDTVSEADGYELLKSSTPDLSVPEIISLNSAQANSYFDPVSGSGAGVTGTRYYKLRATAGTETNPHSVKGLLTGIVSATSIDPADTATAGGTTFDTTTSDDTQTRGEQFLEL